MIVHPRFFFGLMARTDFFGAYLGAWTCIGGVFALAALPGLVFLGFSQSRRPMTCSLGVVVAADPAPAQRADRPGGGRWPVVGSADDRHHDQQRNDDRPDDQGHRDREPHRVAGGPGAGRGVAGTVYAGRGRPLRAARSCRSATHSSSRPTLTTVRLRATAAVSI